MTSPPCRAFEHVLLAALEREPDAPAPAARAAAAGDVHAAGCATAPPSRLPCRTGGRARSRGCPRPLPFLARLAEPGTRLRARASDVLSFSRRALREARAPAPARAAPRGPRPSRRPAPRTSAAASSAGRRSHRLAVRRDGASCRVHPRLRALNVDPMAGRGAATDSRPWESARSRRTRVAAVRRVEDSAIARYAAPLTKRLDYRLYRAFAAGRARAAAYSQLVFEKIFGGDESVQSASTIAPEPSPPIRRS